MKNVYSVTQDEQVLDLLYNTVPVASHTVLYTENFAKGVDLILGVLTTQKC